MMHSQNHIKFKITHLNNGSEKSYEPGKKIEGIFLLVLKKVTDFINCHKNWAVSVLGFFPDILDSHSVFGTPFDCQLNWLLSMTKN